MEYLFPQNSFKEGLARMNHIVVYLRKSLFAKVNRSLKKNKKTLEICICKYGTKETKEPFLENSSGEPIITGK